MTHLHHHHVSAFVTAGKARFTVSNTETGNRFTYRVRTNRTGEVLFVSLLCGPDNESHYSYLGFIRGGVYIHGGRKAQVGPDALGAKAFAWFWRNMTRLPESVEVHHEGRCGRCGRALTVPESIETGLGPYCAGRAQAA